MADLSMLSATELYDLYAGRHEEWNRVAQEVISAGWGYETVETIRRKATDGGDPLAKRFMSMDEVYLEAALECERRMRHHGSLKPIKRREA